MIAEPVNITHQSVSIEWVAWLSAFSVDCRPPQPPSAVAASARTLPRSRRCQDRDKATRGYPESRCRKRRDLPARLLDAR